MSMSALLRAVATRLRSEEVFNDRPTEAVGAFVSIQSDGNPPNMSGQFACVVHPLEANIEDRNALSWSVFYGVGVSVTARLSYSPKDRRGQQMTNTGDLLDRAVAAALALHQDDTHRSAANALIPGTAEYVAVHGGSATVNGFVTPLKVLGIDPPRRAAHGWAGLTDTDNVFVSVVRLGEAHRIQPIGG